MKKTMTTMDKIRIIMWWMKQHKDCGLIATCSVCRSTRIKRSDVSEEAINGTTFYKATYKCMNCHATANCSESWVARSAIKTTESARR